MKRIYAILLFLFTNTIVFTQDFTVDKFTADITLHKEGYFDVVEKYDIDFRIPKHGLYRDFITKYDFKDEKGTVGVRNIEITNVEIPIHKFKRSSKFQEKYPGTMQLKIGDPNKFVEGKQQYEIRYRVNNALILTDSLAQFYWNIKPKDWQAHFNKIEFIIHTPEGTVLTPENSFTYSGRTGNMEDSKEFDFKYANNFYSGITKTNVISYSGLNVTVLIKLPKEFIVIPEPPSFLSKNINWLSILAGLYVVFGLFWFRYGKDDKVITTTSYYPPEDIDPAMAGFLINDNENTNNLISFIPKWGSEGLIKIEELPKEGWLGKNDLKITRLGNLSANAPNYEQTIFNGLFNGLTWVLGLAELLKNQHLNGLQVNVVSSTTTNTSFTIGHDSEMKQTDPNSVKISDLKNTFYSTMSTAKTELSDAAQRYYEVFSEKSVLVLLGITILLTLLLPEIFLFKFGIIAAVVCFISCIVLILLSFTMRKKNKKGNQALAELKGFYQFIKLADVNRIKALIAEDPNYFEKTMSYALSFGLLDKWASKFNSLDVAPPNWYSNTDFSSTGKSFNMNHFTQSFTSNMATVGSAMVSSPISSGSSSSSSHSSSGGGSSGGGFGGGGGGSW